MKNYYLITMFLLATFSSFAQVPCADIDNPPGCPICSQSIISTTVGFTPDSIDYDFPCGTVENSQWYSFIANDSGSSHFQISANCGSSSSGLEAVIYDSNYQPISDCFQIGKNETQEIFATGTIWAQRYFLLIDGIDSSICNFSLKVIRGTTTFLVPSLSFPPSTGLFGGAAPCGESTCFSLSRSFQNASYEWNVPGTATITDGGTYQDTFICVRFDSLANQIELISGEIVGIEIITVTPVNDCAVGDPVELVVAINPDFATVIDTTLCPGSCFLFEGNCYDEPEDVMFEYPCGTITRIDVNFADTTDFSIAAFVDSFTNAVAFGWSDLGADSFDIYINDQYEITQSFSSFLLPLSAVIGDEIKFKVVPSSVLGCQFKTSETVFNLNNSTNITPHFAREKVKIYPNPTSEIVEIESILEIEKVSIYNLSGQLILESYDKKIDLSSYESGVYFLKIKTEKHILTERIIIL